MSVIISIIGKPNTGKSTLFNVLTSGNKSLTDDLPGVTRDTITGEVTVDDFTFTLFDTAGIFFGKNAKKEGFLETKINDQIDIAIEESDGIVFLTDRKTGYLPSDRDIYDKLRKSNKKIYFCVNKVDDPLHAPNVAEFYESGAERIIAISASHKIGLGELTDRIMADHSTKSNAEPCDDSDVSIALIGRPNTGKSTLVNGLLGYDKQIVHDLSGTTRDAVDSLFKYYGKTIKIIDTAGIRKKRKIAGKLEKLSVLSAIRSVDRADIVVLLISAEQIGTDQEMKLAAYVKKNGKPMIIAINKWDLHPKDSNTVKTILERIKNDMPFIAYCPVMFISAKTGQRVGELVKKCVDIHFSTDNKITTNRLVRVIKEASEAHLIARARGKKDKIMFASQLSERPPTFLMRVKFPKSVPAAYKSYIENTLRKHFIFEAQPIRIYWKEK